MFWKVTFMYWKDTYEVFIFHQIFGREGFPWGGFPIDQGANVHQRLLLLYTTQSERTRGDARMVAESWKSKYWRYSSNIAIQQWN